MANNMTYAQALGEAKTLIVQQSNRIKADAEKLKSQADEMARQQATLTEQAAEIGRLRQAETQLAEMKIGREQAEAAVGRQRVQIDELTRELASLRDRLPTEDDASALAAMTALLSAKKKSVSGKSTEASAAPSQPDEATAHEPLMGDTWLGHTSFAAAGKRSAAGRSAA